VLLNTRGEGVQHIACMKHSAEDSSLMQENWRSNGAEILMSGRIRASIEFYHLDTAPMLKFVLESGSGHAIDDLGVPMTWADPVRVLVVGHSFRPARTLLVPWRGWLMPSWSPSCRLLMARPPRHGRGR
jgi:hypothetical protein